MMPPRTRSDHSGLYQAYPASWRWLRIARRINGWLTDAEANALFQLARTNAPEQNAIVVELGSWQGKSSTLLGAGLARKQNAQLFCIDPFLNGDEAFHRNINRCGLSRTVVPIKAYSYDAVKTWRDPIDILFIDAGHDYESVKRDFLDWYPWLKMG